MKKVVLASVLAFSMLSTACSSIVSKSEYAVSLNSTPSGAIFVLSGKDGKDVHSGITPSTVVLKAHSGFFSGETYTLTLNKDGHTTKVYTIDSTVDGWYFGNILFGGVIGMLIVDPATGAMFKLPEHVQVSLDEEKGHTLTVVDINGLSDEDKKSLIKISD
jgi:hypothetical protein